MCATIHFLVSFASWVESMVFQGKQPLRKYFDFFLFIKFGPQSENDRAFKYQEYKFVCKVQIPLKGPIMAEFEPKIEKLSKKELISLTDEK